MPRLISRLFLLVIAILSVVMTWSTLLGLGQLNAKPANQALIAATFGALAPSLVVAMLGASLRTISLATCLWNGGLFLCLGVWAPSHRNDALRLILTRTAAQQGHIEPSPGNKRFIEAIEPSPPDPLVHAVNAEALATTPLMGPPLSAQDIALPYEGDGRHLTIPVVFRHGDREVETYMMLDTGATYTTLPRAILRQLGVTIPADAPTLTLHTANGERTASVVLVDQVWLGDVKTRHIAVTTCDDCAGGEAVGLLGLNVAGGFNMTIDADRREVIFRRRDDFNRILDVRPFVTLSARFTNYPGGRTEAQVQLINHARLDLGSATARVSCDAGQWDLQLTPARALDRSVDIRRLPPDTHCAQWLVSLSSAAWGTGVPSP